MKKTQKIIIIVALTMVLMAIVYPPGYKIIHIGSYNQQLRTVSGRKLIFKIVPRDVSPSDYQRIRYEILGLEILAILILGGIALVVTAKKKD